MRALLRPIMPADVPVLATIYQESIETLAAEDYDAAQRAAWAAAADNLPVFGGSLVNALTVVATLQGRAVGFISTRRHEEIALLYVYPTAKRQGVATMLLASVATLAVNRGATELVVDASDASRAFFEARGFEALHRHTIAFGDQWLANTRMRKALG